MFPRTHRLLRRWRLAYRRFARGFIPPGVDREDLVTRRKVRMLVGCCMLFSVVAPPYAVGRFALQRPVEASAILAAAVLQWIGPWLARRTGRVTAAAHASLVVFFSVLLTLTWFSGGLQAIGLTWLGVVPVTAMVLISRRTAVAYTAFVIVAAGAFYMLERSGFQLDHGLSADNARNVRLMGTLLLFIALPILTSVFGTAQDVALEHERAHTRRLALIRRDLQAALDQSQAAARAKARFLATMSHELRTPMNGVIGMTEMLLDSDLEQDQRMLARSVSHCGDALMSLINDTLHFTRLEEGRVDLRPRATDVRALMEEALALVEHGARAKGLGVHGLVDEAVPCRLTLDGDKLRHVLLGLLANAVKFTEAGAVHVLVEWRSGQLRVEVGDTGPGISPELRGRLFRPFEQADDSTTKTHDGAGLGLAIGKELVQLMGGSIDVESTPGQGSTFRVTLPCEEAEREASQPPTRPLRGLQALLVGCSPHTTRFTVAHLAALGASAGTLPGSDEPLQELTALALTGALPDVLLVEHGAHHDALALGAELLADPALSGLPRLVLEGPGTQVSPDACVAAGYALVLPQPVTAQALRRVLERTLATPRPPVPPAPVAPAGPPASAEHADDDAPPARPDPRPTLLVAEDNAVNQALVERVLSGLGYRVRTAGNGQEAIEAITAEAFDGVIMDCQMPVMDGYEATRRIRVLAGDDLPIIGLSANALEGDRERALAAGMSDYLTKPIRKTQLAAKLAEWTPLPAAPVEDATR